MQDSDSGSKRRKRRFIGFAIEGASRHDVAAMQFARFALVGIVSNAVLFVLYLAMTSAGVGHKVAATIAYAIGVAQTFLANRAWSFGDAGPVSTAFWRYVLVYAFGYVFNIVLLVVLVDYLELNHAIVQGAIILGLAVFFFVLQKTWVFRGRAR